MIICSLFTMTLCAACWAGSIYLILVRRFKNKAALLRYNKLVFFLMGLNLIGCLPLLLWLTWQGSGLLLVDYLLVIATVTDILSTVGLVSFSLVSGYRSRQALPAGEQMIVILGAATHHGHVPPVLAARLDRGICCWQKQPAAKIIVTGGVVHQEKSSEAAAMAAYLIHHGIPHQQIIREETAKNTWQNLTQSAKLIGQVSPVVVVTSDFHVLRVKSYLKKLGLSWTVSGAKTPASHRPLTFVRDYLGLIRDHRYLAVGILLLMIGIAFLWI